MDAGREPVAASKAALGPETILERLWDEEGLVAVITVADVLETVESIGDCEGDLRVAVGDTKCAIDKGDRETVLRFVRWYGVSPSRIRAGFVGGAVALRPERAIGSPRQAPRMRAGHPAGRRRRAARRGPPRRSASDEPDPDPLAEVGAA
jgi:hypothetical protein